MSDTNSTAVATTALTPPQQELLKNLIQTLPQDRQLSWLQLGKSKATVQEALEKKELELQSLLLDFEKLDTTKLETQIDLYKKGLNTLPEIRKGFTVYLDKIGDQLMGIQRRAETYEGFTKAKAHLLNLKIEQDKKENEAGAKTREQNNFRTHITNEYVRIRTEYTIALDKRIVDEYEIALGEELTEDGLKNKVIMVENMLINMPIPALVRFSTTLPEGYVLLNTAEELGKIGEAIPKPDYASILKTRIADMKEKFNLYFSDKANKEAAINHLKAQQTASANQIEQKASQEQGINTLTSKVTGSLSFSSAKPLTKKREIVIKELDLAWEFKIITEFAARFTTCRHRVKIQSSVKLSLAQMVKALQEEPEEIQGIEYTETIKL